MAGPIWLAELGRTDYGPAFALQRYLAAERDAERLPDVLLLLEHSPVITLGRRGRRDHVYAPAEELVRRGIQLHETNRGGLVTYHGPGQVVGYPIARLRQLAGDAPTYVRGLEEAIIRALGDFGIVAARDADHRGVFTSAGKIAAIGVAVSRGVTMHGFAVNVCPDLDHFALINPCGLERRGVTSVERLLGVGVRPADVAGAIVFHLGEVFDRTIVPAPPEFWDLLRAADADRVPVGAFRSAAVT